MFGRRSGMGMHPSDQRSLEILWTGKLLMIDWLIRAEYARFGAPLVSFEKSAHKLPGVKWLAVM